MSPSSKLHERDQRWLGYGFNQLSFTHTGERDPDHLAIRDDDRGTENENNPRTHVSTIAHPRPVSVNAQVNAYSHTPPPRTLAILAGHPTADQRAGGRCLPARAG